MPPGKSQIHTKRRRAYEFREGIKPISIDKLSEAQLTEGYIYWESGQKQVKGPGFKEQAMNIQQLMGDLNIDSAQRQRVTKWERLYMHFA